MRKVAISLLLILLLWGQRKCGDGVGDGVTQWLKTTTPFIRPQKAGYFFNVHEIIGLEKASNDAVSLGLESQIDRMKNEIDEYRDKSYEQQAELKQEIDIAHDVGSCNDQLIHYDQDSQISVDSLFHSLYPTPDIIKQILDKQNYSNRINANIRNNRNNGNNKRINNRNGVPQLNDDDDNGKLIGGNQSKDCAATLKTSEDTSDKASLLKQKFNSYKLAQIGGSSSLLSSTNKNAQSSGQEQNLECKKKKKAQRQ